MNVIVVDVATDIPTPRLDVEVLSELVEVRKWTIARRKANIDQVTILGRDLAKNETDVAKGCWGHGCVQDLGSGAQGQQ